LPHYADDFVTLHLGDCLDVMAAMKESSIAAVVTDPPYALEFMGREWDAFTPAGFQRWCEAWAAECLRVLKPGGWLLAFGGTRTYHRLACGVEDAGFEVRDSLHWIYGSGFPKSLDVSKAVDKTMGKDLSWFGPWLRQERERRGISSHELCERGGFYKNVNHGGLVVNWELGIGVPTAAQFNKVCEILDLPYERIEVLEREVIGRKRAVPGVAFSSTGPTELDVTVPASEAGAQWDGWGTALKPAHEPIVVARKPLAGTVAQNVLTFGTGALNIDGCRVEGVKGVPASPRRARQGPAFHDLGNDPGTGSGWDPNTGRWPANVVFTHSASCEEKCAPDCPVAELDRQTAGIEKGHISNNKQSAKHGTSAFGDFPGTGARAGFADGGGASRFFPVFRYEAKAPKSERPRLPDGTAWPTVKPLELMRWLVRLVTPPGGTVLDPFAGTGTTGEAATLEGFPSLLIERDPVAAELAVQRLRKPVSPALFEF
jgi:hypothetical protein